MITKISTVDMPREIWLQHRQKSIGGSDAGALLGLNPYSSPYALWAEKTGAIVPEDISDKEAVRLGNDLEQYVAERFAEASGKKVRRCNAILKNSEYPFAHANPDRLIVGENAGLEIKTTSSFETLKKCREGQYPDTWYAQIVHYLLVTGMERWYLAVLVFGQGFFSFTIERNQAEVDALAAAEKGFWEYVQTKTPPPVDGLPSTSDALNTIYRESVAMQVDLAPVQSSLYTYRQTKARIAELQKILTEQQNMICSYMGQAERGSCGGFNVSWKSQMRKTFDAKSFSKDNPGIDLSPYYKETTSRPFKMTEV